MFPKFWLICIASLLCLCKLNAQLSVEVPDPINTFVTPPESAQPVLWMWMGPNISKDGITKDLEALKKQGLIVQPCLVWLTLQCHGLEKFKTARLGQGLWQRVV